MNYRKFEAPYEAEYFFEWIDEEGNKVEKKVYMKAGDFFLYPELVYPTFGGYVEMNGIES